MATEPENDEDLLKFDEACERGWLSYLDQFEEQAWPMFEKRGLTKGEAMILWEMNKLYNVLRNIEEKD